MQSIIKILKSSELFFWFEENFLWQLTFSTVSLVQIKNVWFESIMKLLNSKAKFLKMCVGYCKFRLELILVFECLIFSCSTKKTIFPSIWTRCPPYFLNQGPPLKSLWKWAITLEKFWKCAITLKSLWKLMYMHIARVSVKLCFIKISKFMFIRFTS